MSDRERGRLCHRIACGARSANAAGEPGKIVRGTRHIGVTSRAGNFPAVAAPLQRQIPARDLRPRRRRSRRPPRRSCRCRQARGRGAETAGSGARRGAPGSSRSRGTDDQGPPATLRQRKPTALRRPGPPPSICQRPSPRAVQARQPAVSVAAAVSVHSTTTALARAPVSLTMTVCPIRLRRGGPSHEPMEAPSFDSRDREASETLWKAL